MFIPVFIVLIIIVFIRVMYIQYQKKKTQNATMAAALLRARETANSLGMNGDGVAAGILQGTAEQSKLKCLKMPRVDGSCAHPNILNSETGCCDLPPGTKLPQSVLIAGAMKDVGVGMLAGVLMDAMLTAAINKGIKMAASRGAAKAAMATGKSAGMATKAAAAAVRVAKSAKTMVAATKVGVMTAKVATAGGKAAAIGTNAAVCAAGGPVGLAVFVITTSFDIISMALDLSDSAGYASYTTNKALMSMKAVYDYGTEKALAEEGMVYPMLFGLGIPFPDELEGAQTLMLGEIANSHLVSELQKDETDPQLMVDFLEYAMDPENPDMPESILDFLSLIPNKFPKLRDELIFKHMKEQLKPQKKDDWIAHYPELSTKDRIAVTFNEKGCREWNSANRQTWFDRNDMFKPVDADPEAPGEPFVALFTDMYDSWSGQGTQENPEMIPKKMAVKAAICAPYGPLIAFCEKTRKLKQSSQSIDPYAFGARFNYETGVCKFTRTLCSRYGLDYSNNDCKKRPGQGTAEVIFGETITRAFITAFTTPPSYAKKSRLGKKGPCPNGTKDDGTSCWSYTYDRGVGILPNACPSDKEERDGLCHSRCRDDERAELGRCLEKCPSGTSGNTALRCYKVVDMRNAGGPWYDPDKCKPGWKRCKGLAAFAQLVGKTQCCREPPDSSWQAAHEAGGFKYYKNRRNRNNLPTGKTACKSNREYQDLLCYKPCTDRGTVKYRGMATMCSPVGGAGIHKNLFQRTICKWEDYKPHGGICYKECRPGEKDDGLLCNPMQPNAGI